MRVGRHPGAVRLEDEPIAGQVGNLRSERVRLLVGHRSVDPEPTSQGDRAGRIVAVAAEAVEDPVSGRLTFEDVE